MSENSRQNLQASNPSAFTPSFSGALPASQQSHSATSFQSPLLRRSMPSGQPASRPSWATQSLPSGKSAPASNDRKTLLGSISP